MLNFAKISRKVFIDTMLDTNTENAPYIFISYAHKDNKRVLPAIEAMQKRGYRVWYDSGIEAGTEWSNNIATHLLECTAFIAFVSGNSIASENCLDEIAYAKSYRKPSLMIYLEDDVQLPEGTEMQTARFQRMYYSRQLSLEAFVNNLATSPIFDACIDHPQSRPVSVPAPAPGADKPDMSNRKLILIIGGIFIGLALVILILLCSLLMKSDTPPALPETMPSTVPTEVPAADEVVEELQMSDDLFDFTFTLEGVIYQLPFAFSQLTENGWTIASDNYNSSTNIPGMDKEYLSMVKDGKRIYVDVYNDTGNFITIGQSKVGGIEVNCSTNIDFFIAKGFTPSRTSDEIIAEFGTPNNRNVQSDYERLSYGKDPYTSGITFSCYPPDSDMYEYSAIEMNNFIFQGETETNPALPAYLAEYNAPNALGDDLLSGVIQIDGDLYQLPAPVSAFLDHGWEFSKCPAYVVAGGSESVSLSRDGMELSLELFNFAEYQTTPENCAVSRIYVNDYDNVPVELPLGITLGMTLEQVEKIIPDTFERSDGTYSINFSFYEYESREYSLTVSVDAESGILNDITLRNATWNHE